MKSAYLYAPLQETVYMKPPHGVLKQGQEGKGVLATKGALWIKASGERMASGATKVFTENLGFK